MACVQCPACKLESTALSGLDRLSKVMAIMSSAPSTHQRQADAVQTHQVIMRHACKSTQRACPPLEGAYGAPDGQQQLQLLSAAFYYNADPICSCHRASRASRFIKSVSNKFCDGRSSKDQAIQAAWNRTQSCRTSAGQTVRHSLFLEPIALISELQ